jgi:hypothetical protein
MRIISSFRFGLVALNAIILCGVSNADTKGFVSCKEVVVYKEAPHFAGDRTLLGRLSNSTVVSISTESNSEYLVSGGGLHGYVQTYCITLDTHSAQKEENSAHAQQQTNQGTSQETSPYSDIGPYDVPQQGEPARKKELTKKETKKEAKRAARAESDARAAYADELEKAMELQGIDLVPRTVGFGPYPNQRLPNVETYEHTGCGGLGNPCFHGNRMVLTIWGFSGSPVNMLQFAKVVLIPRAQELNKLGFEYVELRSSDVSATFPEGVFDIPISRLLMVATVGQQ